MSKAVTKRKRKKKEYILLALPSNLAIYKKKKEPLLHQGAYK